MTFSEEMGKKITFLWLLIASWRFCTVLQNTGIDKIISCCCNFPSSINLWHRQRDRCRQAYKKEIFRVQSLLILPLLTQAAPLGPWLLLEHLEPALLLLLSPLPNPSVASASFCLRTFALGDFLPDLLDHFHDRLLLLQLLQWLMGP